MKIKTFFTFSKKFISIILIFTLLVNTMVSTGFANIFDGNQDYREILTAIQGEVGGSINIDGNENEFFNTNIEMIIAAKYESLLKDLNKKDSELREQDIKLKREHAQYANELGLDRELVSDTGIVLAEPIMVNSTIVEPANIRQIRDIEKIRNGGNNNNDLKDTIAKVEAEQKVLNSQLWRHRQTLLKMQTDKDGFGRIYTIENLLFGETQEAVLSKEDNDYYNAHKAEIESFEEEYVFQLYSEMKKVAGNTFLSHIYKLTPYVRGKEGPKWNILKQDLKNEIVSYTNQLGATRDSKKWVEESEIFIKMLPYIKPEMGEQRYTKILQTAHLILREKANLCTSNNDCEDFLNLLAKESMLYMKGEENKYSFDISEGYYSGPRDVIEKLAKAKDNYEYYLPVISVALTTYLVLKDYTKIKNIIFINDKAEDEIKRNTMPIDSGLDIFFPSTWMQVYLEGTHLKDVLTSFPTIKHLPSNKGKYTDENGNNANIWWDLGEMLKEDGSAEADQLLSDIIAERPQPNSNVQVIQSSEMKYVDSIKIDRRTNKVIIPGVKILKISALANIKQNVLEFENTASRIMNTTYGDLTVEEEMFMDKALYRRYPNMMHGPWAVINDGGIQNKQAEVDSIKTLQNAGLGLDVAVILISLLDIVSDIWNLMKGGYKLGVSMYKTFKASRMASKSASQVKYIKANLKSLQYFRAWKESGRAWTMSLGAANRIVPPAPAEIPLHPAQLTAGTSKALPPPNVSPATPPAGTPSGLYVTKNGQLFEVVADGKGGIRFKWSPKDGIFRTAKETPGHTNFTATIGEGGTGGSGSSFGNTPTNFRPSNGGGDPVLTKARVKLNARNKRKLDIWNRLNAEREADALWKQRAALEEAESQAVEGVAEGAKAGSGVVVEPRYKFDAIRNRWVEINPEVKPKLSFKEKLKKGYKDFRIWKEVFLENLKYDLRIGKDLVKAGIRHPLSLGSAFGLGFSPTVAMTTPTEIVQTVEASRGLSGISRVGEISKISETSKVLGESSRVLGQVKVMPIDALPPDHWVMESLGSGIKNSVNQNLPQIATTPKNIVNLLWNKHKLQNVNVELLATIRDKKQAGATSEEIAKLEQQVASNNAQIEKYNAKWQIYYQQEILSKLNAEQADYAEIISEGKAGYAQHLETLQVAQTNYQGLIAKKQQLESQIANIEGSNTRRSKKSVKQLRKDLANVEKQIKAQEGVINDLLAKSSVYEAVLNQLALENLKVSSEVSNTQQQIASNKQYLKENSLGYKVVSGVKNAVIGVGNYIKSMFTKGEETPVLESVPVSLEEQKTNPTQENLSDTEEYKKSQENKDNSMISVFGSDVFPFKSIIQSPLPENFQEPGFAYKGLTLNNIDEIDNIFRKGLELSKVERWTDDFASIIFASDDSELAKFYANKKPGIHAVVKFAVQRPLSSSSMFFEDIPANRIKSIAIYNFPGREIGWTEFVYANNEKKLSYDPRSTNSLKGILYDNGYTQDNVESFTRDQIVDLVAFFETSEKIKKGTRRKLDEKFNPANFITGKYNLAYNQNAGKIRVLFVNDNPKAIETLNGENFPDISIDYDYSANSAINKLKSNSRQYDIIITDMVMPDGNGYDLAEYVFKHGLQIPVILSSTLSGTPEELYQRYFDGYIVLDEQGQERVLNYISNFVMQQPHYNFDNDKIAQKLLVDKRLGSVVNIKTEHYNINGFIMSLYGEKVVITLGKYFKSEKPEVDITDFYGNSLGSGKVIYHVYENSDDGYGRYNIKNYAIIVLDKKLPADFPVFAPVSVPVNEGDVLYFLKPGEVHRVTAIKDEMAAWCANTFTIEQDIHRLGARGGVVLNANANRVIGFDLASFEGLSSYVMYVDYLRYLLPDEIKMKLSGGKLSKQIFSYGEDKKLQLDDGFSSVVQVMSVGDKDISLSSGFIYNNGSNQFIITAGHGIKQDGKIKIYDTNNKLLTTANSLIKFNTPQRDYAILRPNTKITDVYSFDISPDVLDKRQNLYFAGFPGGRKEIKHFLFDPNKLFLSANYGLRDMYYLQGYLSYGASGGLIVNEKREAVGIARSVFVDDFWKYVGIQNLREVYNLTRPIPLPPLKNIINGFMFNNFGFFKQPLNTNLALPAPKENLSDTPLK